MSAAVILWLSARFSMFPFSVSGLTNLMMLRFFLPVLLTLLCISVPAGAEPVAWNKPGDQWLSRFSDHFTIHYLQGYDDMAVRALHIAEQVHGELVPFFTAAPAERTQLVLTDSFDYSNGWATPWYFNQIRLYASPPEDVGGLEHMDDWLHGLIRHEYVHILHIDLRRGVAETGSEIFGRYPLFFPHIFTPSLFKEGLAVYLETDKQQGYGRLDSSFYAMQMRMETSAQGPDQLSQAVLTLDDWPSNKAYLYGGYFTEFLAQQYSEKDIGRYLNDYAENIIPYIFQNSSARDIYGKSYDSLWQDFRSWSSEKFSSELQQLQNEEVSGSGLAEEPSYRLVTAISGKQLWWVTDNGKDRSFIIRQSDKSTAQKKLTAGKNITAMDIADDGTLAVSRTIAYVSGEVFNDIFLWNDDDGWQRLTEEMRLRKVRWVNNQVMLASRKQKGLSELWWLDRNGKTQLLWQGPERFVLGGFDVSTDGQFIVAAIKRPQQGWNLERAQLPAVMNNKKLIWRPLTETRATENAPVFLPDNRVLYSADYDGIYNLFILDPDSGMAEQITREVSGAFEPQWLSGQIVYQQYTREGYQLKKIPAQKPLRRFAVSDYQGSYDYAQYPPADTAADITSAIKYQPWSSLRPHYWLPMWRIDDDSSVVGISTSGSDALNRHNYTITAGWDSKQDWAEGQFTYLYDNRWTLAFMRSHDFHDLNLGGDDDYLVTREDQWSVSRDYLLPAFEDQLSFHTGLVYDDEKVVRLPGGVTSGYHYREGLAGVAVTFDNRELYSHVPGIGWGTYFDLVYESNDVIDSYYNGDQWQSRWQQTWDLPQRNTLTFTALGGWADDGTEPFSLGGDSSEEAMLFGRDQFSLRGYDKSVQIGHKYYRGSLNFRWWGATIGRNWGLMPFGLGDFYMDFRVSRGSAWFRDQHRDALDSIAVEASVDLVLGYTLPVPLTVGVAKGLDKNVGKTEGYLGFVVPY